MRETSNNNVNYPVSSGHSSAVPGFRNGSQKQGKFTPETLATFEKGLAFMLGRRGAMAAYQPILEQIEAGIREGRFVEPEDLAKAAHRLIREATTTLPYHPGPDGGAAFSVEDLGLTEREVLILSEYYGARLPETEICSRHNIPPAELKALGRWARAAARRLTEKRQMSA